MYLQVGSLPCLRINGELIYLEKEPSFQKEDVEKVFKAILSEKQREKFEKEWELDLAISIPDIGRFRVNAFRERGKQALVFRHVKTRILNFAELNLPVNILESLSLKPRGIVLITGAAGSGKSTTLASMVEYINTIKKSHIITLEDPVEFLFENKKSLISQREISLDTESFATALKHIVRQSPDIIMLGEMRDQETISAALTAAEIGHLVLTTLHTIDASQTIERMINYFPPYQHNQVQMQLALTLQGIISQRLIRRVDREGRILAVEILISTPTVKELLIKGRTDEILSVIKEGNIFCMKTFNQSLLELYREKKISREDALANADNPDELELNLKGIFSGKDTHKI